MSEQGNSWLISTLFALLLRETTLILQTERTTGGKCFEDTSLIDTNKFFALTRTSSVIGPLNVQTATEDEVQNLDPKSN